MRLDTSTDPQVGYRPPGPLDFTTALSRYDGPFSRRQAAHLLRRAGFGGTASEVDTLSQFGAQQAVDSLLHPAQPEVELVAYPDTTLLYDLHKQNITAQNWWLDRMLRTQRPLSDEHP
jgi:hypothetical protein